MLYKAQGTIEYLVILAVVVIVGLVVVSIMMSSTQPAQGISGTTSEIVGASAPLSVSETIVSPDGNYYLKLTNNTGKNIIITSINVGDDSGTPNKVIPPNGSESFIINTDDICQEGGTVSDTVTIIYEDQEYHLSQLQDFPGNIQFECGEYETLTEYTDEEGQTQGGDSGPASPSCGNNIAELGEMCDGTDLNGTTTCSGYDPQYDGGTLSCNNNCLDWNTGLCTTSPPITLSSSGSFTPSDDLIATLKDGYDSSKTYKFIWYKNGQPEATTLIENGLVAYYPFTTDSTDFSANSNDGTINGAASSGGKVGSGINFDGLDDYVFISDDSSLDLTDNMTISMWVKGGQEDVLESLLSKSSYSIKTDPQNRVYFEGISDNALTSATNMGSFHGTRYQVDTFNYYDKDLFLGLSNCYLYAYRYNGSTFSSAGEVHHYCDSATTGLNYYNGSLLLSTSSWNGKNGIIREYGGGTSWTTYYSPPISQRVFRGHVSYDGNLFFVYYNYSSSKDEAYTFDGTTSTKIFDSSGNGMLLPGVFNGKLYLHDNRQIVTYDDSQLGTPVTFTEDTRFYSGFGDKLLGYQGTSGNFDIITFDGTNTTDLFSVDPEVHNILGVGMYNDAIYVMGYNSSNQGRLKIYRNGSLISTINLPWRIYGSAIYDGKLYVGTANGTSSGRLPRVYELGTGFSMYSDDTVTPADDWQHIVAAYDGSEIQIYVDGSLSVGQSESDSFSSTSEDLYIGGAKEASAVAYYQPGRQEFFDGSIDEVMIFNRALDLTEIQQLYYGTAWDGNIMDASRISSGEEWKVGFSYSTDGTTWSADVNSDPVTIS